jgi:hypothetical protein
MAPKTFEEAEKAFNKTIAYMKAAQSQIQRDRNYVIPERTSSLIAPRARQVSQRLYQATLQCKASKASLASSTGSTKSIDYLRAEQRLLRAQSQEWKNVDEGLVEAFSKLSLMTKDEYMEQQVIIQKHRFELVSKEIIIARNIGKFQSQLENHKEPDWPSVIMNLVSKTFLKDRHNKVDPEDRRSETEHGEWKELICSFYNAYNPKDSTKIWCPITQRYSKDIVMKTAHIVPHSFGYKNIGHTFGEPWNGMGLMWSYSNGLPMLGSLEAIFDEGRWTMIGHPQEGRPIEYTFVVIDDSILDSWVGFGKKKFRDYNNKRLVFKNDRRPDAKFVYWHYATSLLRHYKQQSRGIEQKIRTLVDGRAWGNVEPWYDSSTLKYMAEYWGDVSMRVFKDTEIRSDEVAGMGGMSLEDDNEEEDSRLAAGAVFKELISDDFCEVVEDEYREEESEL